MAISSEEDGAAATGNMHKNLLKFGGVVFELHEWADRQTVGHTHTRRNNSHPSPKLSNNGHIHNVCYRRMLFHGSKIIAQRRIFTRRSNQPPLYPRTLRRCTRIEQIACIQCIDASCCYRCLYFCLTVCLSVCLRVGHDREPCKNGRSDRDAVWS